MAGILSAIFYLLRILMVDKLQRILAEKMELRYKCHVYGDKFNKGVVHSLFDFNPKGSESNQVLLTVTFNQVENIIINVIGGVYDGSVFMTAPNDIDYDTFDSIINQYLWKDHFKKYVNDFDHLLLPGFNRNLSYFDLIEIEVPGLPEDVYIDCASTIAQGIIVPTKNKAVLRPIKEPKIRIINNFDLDIEYTSKELDNMFAKLYSIDPTPETLKVNSYHEDKLYIYTRDEEREGQFDIPF